MPPISEQFYDDDSDEDDDNNGDNAEGTESLSSAPSENETAENELKVSASPLHAPHISQYSHPPSEHRLRMPS